MLRYVSYAVGYGEFALGREHFQTLPAEIQSVNCADCSTGSCAVTTAWMWRGGCARPNSYPPEARGTRPHPDRTDRPHRSVSHITRA